MIDLSRLRKQPTLEDWQRVNSLFGDMRPLPERGTKPVSVPEGVDPWAAIRDILNLAHS